MSGFFIQEIDDAQRAVDGWYQESNASLTALHSSLKLQLFNLEQRLTGGCDRGMNNDTNTNSEEHFHTQLSRDYSNGSDITSTPGKHVGSQNSLNDVNNICTSGASPVSVGATVATSTALAQKITAETLCTPLRPAFGVYGKQSSSSLQFSLDQYKPPQQKSHNYLTSSSSKRNYDLDSTPGLASPPLKNKSSAPNDVAVTVNDAAESLPGINTGKSERIYISGEDSDTQSINQQHQQQKQQFSIDTMRNSVNKSSTRCHVHVEFKRQRVVQYDSAYYVAPGEYVVVGGDRGEDVGLVKRTWTDAEDQQSPHTSCSEGMGEVLRLASVLEITQLQGVQTELEKRAVQVAQEKVEEHDLPMRIVDAEYQFDRRKLTFFYQSQHRLDFRNLVRVLYKTFRARIWMEPDTPQ